VGIESTVLDVTQSPPLLLRPGGLPLEDIEAAIGSVCVREAGSHPDDPDQVPQASPGLLRQHYAPRTPLVISADRSGDAHHIGRVVPCPRRESARIGLLALTPEDSAGFAAVETLSPAGDLREAAATFFAALSRLDHQHLDLIVARPFPEQGLGRALNDRLRRAAATFENTSSDA
jgi:L-threonylcarbamoyladenylate synthase